MTISIDYGNTNIITVEQSDCTLVSGTLYKIDTNTLRLALKDIEDSETGMPFPRTNQHNTEVTVAGITYFRTIEILAPYSIQFLPDSAWSVRLEGSNNNFWDIEAGILVQNQVQVIPTNSAGAQTVSSGSGLDAAQDSKLTRVHAVLDVIEGTLDHQEVMRVLLAAVAGKVAGASTTNVTIRDQADGKDRIDATVDEFGNRTAVTVDAS